MSDYISRDAALEMLDGIYDCNDMVFSVNDSCVGLDCGSCRWRDTRDYIRDKLTRIHAADVVARDCHDRLLAENDELRKERPVRHGKWREVENGESGRLCECSACKEWMLFYYGFVANFCPNCGALMKDGDEDV